MSPLLSILRLDARGILRDHVALATLVLSLVGTLGIMALGLYQERLPGWSEWVPFVIAVSLVGGPGGFGFLFGVLMVEEGESGVRQALAVAPVPPARFMMIRTVIATGWMCVWPLASVVLMNSTWRAVDLSLLQWITVVGPLALLTSACALLIPAVARDRVGALAVFKGLSFLCLIPLGLFFVRSGAPYRAAFLLSPTGWVVEAYGGLLRSDGAAAFWGLGAVAYALTLLLVAIFVFRRNVYRLHA
jgi:hypothetical protein